MMDKNIEKKQISCLMPKQIGRVPEEWVICLLRLPGGLAGILATNWLCGLKPTLNTSGFQLSLL